MRVLVAIAVQFPAVRDAQMRSRWPPSPRSRLFAPLWSMVAGSAGDCPSRPAVRWRALDPLPGCIAFQVQALLGEKPVALLAKPFQLSLHPLEQRFRRGGANSGALELKDFFALATNLRAHVLDLGTDVFDCGHGQTWDFAQKNKRRTKSQDPLALELSAELLNEFSQVVGILRSAWSELRAGGLQLATAACLTSSRARLSPVQEHPWLYLKSSGDARDIVE
ncbi:MULTISPECIES: hypothetical protein [Bradyrhizobium]|uniref:hypothetical protein n=1 Tax=Bradyrhizobium TaxID=374 RepID=UPI001427C2EC|nr:MULTISPECIES: hypothetical protein [Bradyrhizobium]UFW54099.1 hypothetical protein BaraCB756_24060 [Bradyrhizobium arachidis]